MIIDRDLRRDRGSAARAWWQCSVCRGMAGAGLAAACIAMAGASSLLAAEQSVGRRIELLPDALPAPFATPVAINPPRTIARPKNATLNVPPGFRVNIFADRLIQARWLAVAPDGAVLVAEPKAGKLTMLRDRDGDGRADRRSTYVRGLRRPHGMAFHDGFLYVADTQAVWRVPYRPKRWSADAKPEPVTAIGALGAGGSHWTRNLVFSPDGSKFYVTVGSQANVAEEPEPHATVQVFDADGGNQQTYAGGLRNPVGIDIHPETGEVYVVVNERDGLGDGLVPDYFTRLTPGAFYGWPYAYIGSHRQPGFAERNPAAVRDTLAPDLLFRSHSAPLGLVFYNSEQFPEAYRGSAFVALRGSWNASKPRGYMVVRVPFEEAVAKTHYEVFATGFWASGRDTAVVWGRPAGLAVAADGSLLVADDVSNTIWRISYPTK